MGFKDVSPQEAVARKLSEELLTKQATDVEQVEVTVMAGDNLLMDYINEEFDAIENHLAIRGGSCPSALTRESFTALCLNAIQDRVAWVTHQRYNFHPAEKIAYPAFLSNILANVGRAQDLTLGIVLIPRVENPQKYDKDELHKVSDALQSLGAFGFQYSLGYPKDRFGSWEFMAMQLVGQTVRRHDALAHPVYATMAAVLGLTMVREVLSPRVRYGDVGMIRPMLRQVVSFASA